MRRVMFLWTAVSLALVFPAAAAAIDADREVVVTAARVETAAGDIPSSVTVVSGEEIEESGARTVAEVLETVPGLEFNSLGGVGQQQSLFLRGADPEHVVVLIDGIEVNDPSSPKRAFNWAHLPVDNIDRIEVLRGGAGALYGSDAMAGVVSIITRRGQGKTRVGVEVEDGSFQSALGRLTVSGGTVRTGYSLTASTFDTEGISAAEEADGNNEKDSYRSSSLSGRLDLALGPVAHLQLTLAATDSSTELDEINGTTFLFGDDPNSVIDEETTVLGAWLDLTPAGGPLDQRLGVSHTSYRRDYVNAPDALNPNDDSEQDDGAAWHLTWQGTLDLDAAGLLTVGADYDRDSVQSSADFSGFPITVDRRKTSSVGVFIQEQLEATDVVKVTMGARLDDPREADRQVTWQAGAVAGDPGEGLLMRANIATGFKAPTLYQLYNSSSGNPDLASETSRGWEAGLETTAGPARIGLSLFDNRFQDLIDFSGLTYFNVDEAVTRGAEFFAFSSGTAPLTWRLSYTALQTEDVTTGEDLIRRPENKLSLAAGYRFGQTGRISLTGIAVGRRTDKDFSSWPATTVALESYTLVDLAGVIRLGRGLELSGRVENLLDEDYQEAFGYGTPGVSTYLGVKGEL